MAAASANASSEAFRDAILTKLDEEKAEEIVAIDLRGRSEMVDWMVICSGRSTRRVAAIAEKLVEHLKQDHDRFAKVEGKSAGHWVLVDPGDAVIHVFRPEVREFYQLEKMWMPAGTAPASKAADHSGN